MSVKLMNVTVEMPLFDLHLRHRLAAGDNKSQSVQEPIEIVNSSIKEILALSVGDSYYATISDGQGAEITKLAIGRWSVCYQAGALMTKLLLSDVQLNLILDTSKKSIEESILNGDL